jgi:putative transposase
LFEARKRHDLTVLNYMVTSNHIHLLVVDGEDREAIPRTMQLAAGRTAQEYNVRKRRRGAFWEDRYHATAVESGEHLRNCMAYIDLNMCRAGAVSHPAQWDCCGYQEIQTPRERYRIIDREGAARLLGYESPDALSTAQEDWIKSSLAKGDRRQTQWSESVAIGSEGFVRSVQQRLGIRARHRKVEETDGRHVLREEPGAYHAGSLAKSTLLSGDNTVPLTLERW